jgi:hypothetical protein
MVTGVAVLGTLAGSLSSFFRLDEDEPISEPQAPSDGSVMQDLTAEVAALRRQVEVLTERLSPPDPGP